MEIISGKNEEFNKLLSGLNIGSLPNRFAHVLANIAFAHGIEFYSVLEKLEYQANGFGSDKMHPRFIAYMLRLGDLLDVDDKRFNVFDEKVFTSPLPNTSQLHKEKHAATKHLLISPESIEVTVDCKTDEIYRIAREWFDWLQTEIENQSREWTNIAPREIYGMPPTISKGKLKVLYGSVEPKKELMNLRFAISSEKVFEMFEGSAIYENAEFVFIRELVQNAIDATKIQVWKSVLSGIYDFAIRKHLKLDHNVNHEQIINSIKFPVDLPPSIFENFVIQLNIFWSPEDQNELIIEIIDNGTGISEKDLVRMTSKVGESHSKDYEYIQFKKSMPYWLRPTGAFGIGLQSLFLVAPYFTVQTKTENEESKEVIFHTAKRGDYSRITGVHPLINRGTKVSLKINKSRFKEIFSNTFSIDLVDNYDHFSDKYGNIYLHKIEYYIKKELSKIQLLNANILDKSIIKSLYKNSDNFCFYPDDCKKEIREEKILCNLISWGKTNIFIIYENIIVGSDIKIVFIDTFFDDNRRVTILRLKKRNTYIVRDIPTNENLPLYYKTNYCSIEWNLESPESDKILNISREKLVNKTKEKFDKDLLEIILPTAIKLMQFLFEEKYGTVANKNEQVAITYFHIELSAIMVDSPVKNMEVIYDEFELPSELVITENNEKVKLKKFFKYSRVYIISKIYSVSPQPKEYLNDVWKIIQEKEKFPPGCVIIKQDYFESYLQLSNYFVSEYRTFDQSDGKVILLTLDNNIDEFTLVNIDENSKNSLLKRTTILHDTNRREQLLPIKHYASLAVKNISYDGFYHAPVYVKHSIISPFRNDLEIQKIYQELKSQIAQQNRGFVIDLIKKSYLLELAPAQLIMWVKENSSQAQFLNDEIILNTYAELISDILISRNT